MFLFPRQPKNTHKYFARDLFRQNQVILALVNSATPVANPNNKYMWKYQITPAYITYTTGNYPVLDGRNEGTFDAFSISELGNETDTFSYGVDLSGVTQFTSVPPTVFPVKIPSGTPVVAVPHRLKNTGQVIYIIINTQAISGTCD